MVGPLISELSSPQSDLAPDKAQAGYPSMLNPLKALYARWRKRQGEGHSAFPKGETLSWAWLRERGLEPSIRQLPIGVNLRE
jgi:hypothetical protein